MGNGHLTEEFGALKAPGRNRTHPSASVFVDHVHYQPWVYEELNNILLNVLCNGQESPNTFFFKHKKECKLATT